MTRRLVPALALAAVMATGCRNPFDPSATIRFDRFFAGPTLGYVLSLDQSLALTYISGVMNDNILTSAQFSNTSSVPAKMSGYTVVYRQISTGLPIPMCGGAAGRRFNAPFYINALSDNLTESAATSAQLMIVTSELMTHVSNDLSTTSGGIDCEITFYGEDENGHDVTIKAVLHIDIF